ncbi:hypothetical protein BURC_00685 [Burkholderiaceae bacterium]|nr:hypothetical protein BURC_00685 [Burkholderiaceae bacterium]
MTSMDPTGIGAESDSFDDAALETPIEQVMQAEDDAALPPTRDITPVHAPIITLAKRAVSGAYRSAASAFQLELRVDVDRTRPTKRVSGDFFSVSGATKSYFGSFVVNTPVITTTASLVTIEGLGKFTWSASFPKIRVTVPRVSLLQPQAAATLTFLSLTNAPGASYACPFESVYFRTVQIETDRVSDVAAAFVSYNTGSLPSGGTPRTLSVASAFAEAGIRMQISAASNEVNVTEAGTTWSDAELHASMVKHFSLWQDVPQFKVWQLVAKSYDSPSVLGIMFDQQGKHRQGCAVFHGGLGGATADKQRLQLYAYVHELGHCLNLLHSWQKSLATPPGVNRPSSLSWMNYPQMYPAGSAAFWNAFAFQFDDQELVHLRHAFLNNVVMGGSNFAVGAGLEDVGKFNPPLEDLSGLKLEISAARSFALGEPVVIDITLHATDTRGKAVHPYLHPAAGLVNVAICKPGGKLVAYEPMIDQCVAPQEVAIDPGAPISESVFIGYGHDGLYFGQPGIYELRAVYNALDGSQVVSNLLQLRVRSPITAADDEIADLLLTDGAGALFYLQGSDADELRSARDDFDLLIDKFATHPLAAYARLAKGANLARNFKTVRTESNTVHVRSANIAESDKLLAGLVERAPEERTPDRAALTAAMVGLAEPNHKAPGKAAHAKKRGARAPAKVPARSYG